MILEYWHITLQFKNKHIYKKLEIHKIAGGKSFAVRESGYSVEIINPLEMKRYRCQGIRNPKTDSIDAMMIAQFGIDFWNRPIKDYSVDAIRADLKLLGAQYASFMKTRQDRCLLYA